MARYALTIFTSAFLLFQVQPLIARFILPWFGGGPAIWTTCMLFFQVALLGGYLYAHLLSVGFSLKRQAAVHLGLVVASLLLLPIIPSESLKPSGEAAPTTGILLLLLATVGAPYFMLSSTGPLMQRWFSRSYPGRSPYRLYSLSNVGSLLALLSYPFVIEPMLRLRSQAWNWSAGYVVYAALTGWCALRLLKSPGDAEETAETDATEQYAGIAAPGIGRMVLWLGLSAAGSAMLLATTNQMCIDVAVVPFLWVLPLSLYLLTFVICFDNPRWYDRRVFGVALVLAAATACWQLRQGVDTTIPGLVAVYSAVMFACCMACHGELVHSRPDPRYLTTFYLLVSLGGALGGLFVAVAAPAWFNGFWEYHIALAACCAMTLAAWCANRVWQGPRSVVLWIWIAVAASQIGAVIEFVYREQAAAYEAGDAESFTPLQTATLFTVLGLLHLVGCVLAADAARRWRRLAAIWTTVTLLHLTWVVGFVGAVSDPVATTNDLLLLTGWCCLSTVAGFFIALTIEERETDLFRSFFLFGALQAAAISALVWLFKKDVISKDMLLNLLAVYGVVALVGAAWTFAWVRSIRMTGVWLWAPAGTACLLLGLELQRLADEEAKNAIYTSRNFYGLLQVSEYTDQDLGGYSPPDEEGSSGVPYYSLTHGQIEHGLQYRDEFWRKQPTTYYGPTTGVDLAIRLHPKRWLADPDDRGLKIGVIGLGAGTVAAYGTPLDTIRFYEINPQVRGLSDTHFTYLRDSEAKVEVVLGDARITMASELAEGDPQQFDVLIVDAFSSDAIPIHLITREAADVYQQQLKRDGLLLIHISNRYLDLNPIARGIAQHMQWDAVRIDNDDNDVMGVYGSTWIIVTNNAQFLADQEVLDGHLEWDEDDQVLLWTDDFASLWQVLSY